jgi:cytochrome c biogenesis protein CcdA
MSFHDGGILASAVNGIGPAVVGGSLLVPVVIGGALLDSINPCVIGVLILLLTVLSRAKMKRAMLINGAAYTLGVYVTYLVGGLTLLAFFEVVGAVRLLAQALYMSIGTFVVAAGFLEIKDFFWYGRGFSLAIPVRFVKYMESKVQGTHASLAAAFGFGVVVTLIELPCTGAPYLAVLTIMKQATLPFLEALGLLMLYNLIFIAPLLFIIFIAYRGTGLSQMEHWRREHRGLMRLFMGAMLLALGVFIYAFISLTAAFWSIPVIAAIVLAMAVWWKHGHHGHRLFELLGKKAAGPTPRPRRRKGIPTRALAIAGAGVLIALLLAYSLFTYYQIGAERGIVICDAQQNCFFQAHIHMLLFPIVCGEERRFATEVGPLREAHTHEEKNTVHWHATVPYDIVNRRIADDTPLKLGTAMDKIGVPLTAASLYEFSNGQPCPGEAQPGTVKVFVNTENYWLEGSPWLHLADPREYVWQDRDIVYMAFDSRSAEEVRTFLEGQRISWPLLGVG